MIPALALATRTMQLQIELSRALLTPQPRTRDRNDRGRDDRDDTPDTLLEKHELDAARHANEGPELPPAVNMIVRGDELTLALEPVDELVNNVDEVPDAGIRCDNPVTLRGAR